MHELTDLEMTNEMSEGGREGVLDIEASPQFVDSWSPDPKKECCHAL